jgi:CelD/BcsL family acetyltransferase involved in cellulose biosynthesis
MSTRGDDLAVATAQRRARELAGAAAPLEAAVPQTPAPRGPAADGRSLHVQVVTDPGSFLGLEKAWNELVERAGVPHPFLTHEWMRTFWECFAAGRKLHVVVVRDGPRPIAIAPLMFGKAQLLGRQVRQLESIANVHSPRFEFVLLPAHAEAACRAIWRYITTQRSSWDVLLLKQLPRGAATLAHLRALAEADGFLSGEWPAGESPYIPLRGSWDAYEEALSAKYRSNLRNRTKRLQKLGPVEHEVVTADADLAATLEEGLRIEAAAWKQSAGTAILSRADSHLFYARLAQRAARRGCLRLCFLRSNRRRIAFGYNLVFANRLFVLKNGYDPEFAAYSPYRQLSRLELISAFELRLAEYDLLGVRDDWKTDWTAEARPQSWLYVFANGAFGRLAHAVKFRMVPALQRRPALRDALLRAVLGARRLLGGGAKHPASTDAD